MEIIESDLGGQISDMMSELDMKANEIHAIRSLLQAAHAQILRKDAAIKKLKKELRAHKDLKEE